MNEYRFDGQVAVITGAGSGLGRAYARLLASRGARVVVNDVSDAAVEVTRELVHQGFEAVAAVHPVGTREAAAAIVADAVAAFGSVDILINNAGVLGGKSFHSMTTDQLDRVLDVHLRGAFHLAQQVYIGMRERCYGRIVNTASAAGLYGNFGQANYSAAKMALVGLTRTIAIEGAKYGVSANVIAPGAKTAMTAGLIPDDVDMDVDAVAPMVAWMCHRECPWTGEIGVAAGGRFARAVIGETAGVFIASPTVESVAAAANWIGNLDGVVFPRDIREASAIGSNPAGRG